MYVYMCACLLSGILDTAGACGPPPPRSLWTEPKWDNLAHTRVRNEIKEAKVMLLTSSYIIFHIQMLGVSTAADSWELKTDTA